MSPDAMYARPKRLVATPELIDLMRQVYPGGGWMAVQVFYPELQPKQITSMAHSRRVKLNQKGRFAVSERRSNDMKSRAAAAREAATSAARQVAPKRYADWSKPDTGTSSTSPARHRYPSVFHLAQGISA